MAQSAILRRLYGYLSQGKQPEDVYSPGPPPDSKGQPASSAPSAAGPSPVATGTASPSYATSS